MGQFEILHISDLHLTEQHKSLDQAWNPVAPILKSRRGSLDLLVVSGDLSQRADPAEYAELKRFADSVLLPLVKEGNRKRVVFVPGNHDVSWGADIYKRLSLLDLDSTQLMKFFSSLEQPANGSRHAVNRRTGHTELLEIDRARYRQRFVQVQAFLDEFYGDCLADADDHAFNLLEQGEDWSIHSFLQANLVVVGLNSCHENDRHWHGACFDERSLACVAARLEAIRAKGADPLIIAVWHHGFTSDLGRPDRLLLSSLGELNNLGMSIGFHGHTHANDARISEFLNGDVAIVATGSLGAGPPERPEAVTNQISLCRIWGTDIEVTPYSLQPSQRQFKKESSRRLRFGVGRPPIPHTAARCTKQHREWLIGSDGIAKVVVTFEDVESTGGLELAVVSPPFCSSEPGKLEVGESRHEVECTRMAGGANRYVCRSPIRGSARWTYYVSNVAALNQSELLILPGRSEAFPNLDPHEDARAHTVRVETGQLALTVEFEAASFDWSELRLLAEVRSDELEERTWTVDDAETERVRKSRKVDQQAQRITVTIDGPRLNTRYSIVFKPPEGGVPIDGSATNVAAKVVELTRRTTGTLVGELTSTVATAIKYLGYDDAHFTGHMWDPESRLLMTSFGKFPPQSWSARFSAGDGVAGHCFRFSKPVAWIRPADVKSKESSRRSSVIYRDYPNYHKPQAVRYEWVVAVPLQINADGPSIGVVAFAGAGGYGALRDLCIRPEGSGEALERLMVRINVAFWETLANQEAFAAMKEFCAERANAFVQP